MGRIKIVIIVLLIIGAGFAAVYLYFSWNKITFNPGDGYDPSVLDFMDVIYDNRTDIYAFNEGYSESDACPWGFEHNGIDYFLLNDSRVLAATPGQVVTVEWRDNGEEYENRFYIRLDIRFSKKILIGYNFEPWTQNSEDKDKQLAMFKVQKGDWVGIGQEIARFLYVGGGAHIHFDVTENNGRSCPQQYFSTEGYNELMEMIHTFNPSWELCYP
ncbi:MAG: hypothetical protein H7645_07245 [Candidatus Heimdallarchaeota archaeon]|nr:hypothetical protein [Candidatus Heimdallarchaeota archaeon]MCK4770119.1 hypothetical protein [Candidatus Heimdallarchaeota archaeon]